MAHRSTIFKTRDDQRGFTLVEMMVVVAIISLLVVIAIPSFAKARKNALARKCISNQRIIYQAVLRYETDYNTTLNSIKNDGVAIRNTLVNAGYVSNRGAFECPGSQTKDYDDILLLYSGTDFTNTTCSIDDTHVLQ
jgi:prepilin-type N-terminal cleavage/methylation domain-containing protein